MHTSLSLAVYWGSMFSHQFCVRVVPAEDGQVMPETCRDIEFQYSASKSEVCIKLVVFIT
jgi:hypothetical protein